MEIPNKFPWIKRALARRLLTVPLVTVLFALIGIGGLSPVLQNGDSIDAGDTKELEVQLRATVKEMQDRKLARDKQQGDVAKNVDEKLDAPKASGRRSINPTWLTSGYVEITAIASDDRSPPIIQRASADVEVRPDRLALLLAAWLLAVMLLVLGPSLVAPSVVARNPITELSAEVILEREADLARTQARALYSRSTLLLLGGIVIAFLGVVVFYLALPSDSYTPPGRVQKLELVHKVLLGESSPMYLPRYSGDAEYDFLRRREFERRELELRFLDNSRRGGERAEKPLTSIERFSERSPEHFAAVVKEVLAPVSFKDMLSEQVTRSLRPFGTLIFIEGIAWFLLRQYRTLMEDYKSFHRGYLRRVNTLIAYKLIMQNPAPTPAATGFISQLFGEDLSGRLKKDETTEEIEARKTFNEPNPIREAFERIAEKANLGGAVKKNGEAPNPDHSGR